MTAAVITGSRRGSRVHGGLAATVAASAATTAIASAGAVIVMPATARRLPH
jgi:hypothetical protein